jgi:hypothetical protein
VPDDQQERPRTGRLRRRRRETPIQFAERIGDAYGLVLLLILVTFAVTMTLPPEGSAGRVAAVACSALTAIIAFTSSSVRAARVRAAVAFGALAVLLSVGAEAVPQRELLGAAFLIVAAMLTLAAATILQRVVDASVVDFRTILGAISVFTLLGLLFAFLFLGIDRWQSTDFFTGVAHPRASDFLFFSYTTLTTTGYGNLIPSSEVGQSFAVFEMLVGQIFLVTLVAGLVSLWRPGSAKADVERQLEELERPG